MILLNFIVYTYTNWQVAFTLYTHGNTIYK